MARVVRYSQTKKARRQRRGAECDELANTLPNEHDERSWYSEVFGEFLEVGKKRAKDAFEIQGNSAGKTVTFGP